MLMRWQSGRIVEFQQRFFGFMQMPLPSFAYSGGGGTSRSAAITSSTVNSHINPSLSTKSLFLNLNESIKLMSLRESGTTEGGRRPGPD